eukprot:m.398707 g.398707  ORF g.398707 m.398707 type:complete len:70 (-) comp16778_c0_seq14:138-347(-)
MLVPIDLLLHVLRVSCFLSECDTGVWITVVKVVWLLIVGVGCGHPLIGGPACRACQALAVTCEEELASS